MSFRYEEECSITRSTDFYGQLVNRAALDCAVKNAIDALDTLDRIKKALFYGRKLDGVLARPGLNCRSIAASLPGGADDLPLVHAVLGIAGEAGELLTALDVSLGNRSPLDAVNVVEELGDTLFFVHWIADHLGVSLDAVQRANIAKIRRRYPNEFDACSANKRDEEAERRALEKIVDSISGMR